MAGEKNTNPFINPAEEIKAESGSALGGIGTILGVSVAINSLKTYQEWVTKVVNHSIVNVHKFKKEFKSVTEDIKDAITGMSIDYKSFTSVIKANYAVIEQYPEEVGITAPQYTDNIKKAIALFEKHKDVLSSLNDKEREQLITKMAYADSITTLENRFSEFVETMESVDRVKLDNMQQELKKIGFSIKQAIGTSDMFATKLSELNKENKEPIINPQLIINYQDELNNMMLVNTLAKKSFDDLMKHADNLSLDELNARIGHISDGVDTSVNKTVKKLKELIDAIDATNNSEFKDLKLKMENSLNAIAETANKNKQSMKDMAKTFKTIDTEANKIKAFETLIKDTQEMSNSFSHAFNLMKEKIEHFGKKYAYVIGIIATSLIIYKSLEQELNTLRQEFDVTNGEFNTFVEISMRASAGARTTTNEIIKMMSAMGGAGLQQQLLNGNVDTFLGTMTKFSTLMGMSASSVSELLKSFGQMGMSVNEMDGALHDVGSTILTVTKYTAMTRQEANRTVEIFADLAATLGYTAEQGTALIKEMVTLQGVLSQSLSPKIAQDFMQIMGEMTKGTVKGMTDVAILVGTTAEEFKKLDEFGKFEQLTKGIARFGKLTYLQAQAIAESTSLSTESLMRMSTQIQKAGSVEAFLQQQKVLKQQMDSVSGLDSAWKRFTGTISNLWDRIKDITKKLLVLVVEPMVTVLKGLLEGIIWVVSMFTNALTLIPRPIRMVVIGVIGLIATMGLLSTVLKSVGAGLATMGAKFITTTGAMLGYEVASAGAGASTVTLAGSIATLSTITPVLVEVGAAMMLFGVAIAGVGLGIAQLAKAGFKGLAVFGALVAELAVIGTLGTIFIPMIPVFITLAGIFTVLGAGLVVLSSGLFLLGKAIGSILGGFMKFKDAMTSMVGGFKSLETLKYNVLLSGILKLYTIATLLYPISLLLLGASIGLNLFSKGLIGIENGFKSLALSFLYLNALSAMDVLFAVESLRFILLEFTFLLPFALLANVSLKAIKTAFAGFNVAMESLASGIEWLSTMNLIDVFTGIIKLQSILASFSMLMPVSITAGIVGFMIKKAFVGINDALESITLGFKIISLLSSDEVEKGIQSLRYVLITLSTLSFISLGAGITAKLIKWAFTSFADAIPAFKRSIDILSTISFGDLVKGMGKLFSFFAGLVIMSPLILITVGVLYKLGGGFKAFGKGLYEFSKGIFAFSIVDKVAENVIKSVGKMADIIDSYSDKFESFAEVGNMIGKPMSTFANGLADLSFGLYALQDVNMNAAMDNLEIMFNRLGNLNIGNIRDVIETFAESNISEEINELATSVLNLADASSSMNITKNVTAQIEETEDDKLYKEKMIKLADNMELLLQEIANGNETNKKLALLAGRQKQSNATADVVVNRLANGVGV